jgi:uncharacterized membrane protein
MLSAALLTAVFPANVTMALQGRRRAPLYRALTWLRLPLQVPLVTWAWQAGRQPATRALTPAKNKVRPSR